MFLPNELWFMTLSFLTLRDIVKNNRNLTCKMFHEYYKKGVVDYILDSNRNMLSQELWRLKNIFEKKENILFDSKDTDRSKMRRLREIFKEMDSGIHPGRHPNAIYVSRLLNFKNLPEPVN